MAELKGIFQFTGSLNDITVYEMNGKLVLRRKGTVPKEKVLNHPNFKRRRETMSEFGGTAQVAKAIRTGWNTVKKQFQGSYISGRLNGILKTQVTNQGQGKRGERSISLQNNPDGLIDFPFDRNKKFDYIFPQALAVVPNQARQSVDLTSSKFNPSQILSLPKGATHYQITLLISTISEYKFDPKKKAYLPKNQTQNGLFDLQVTSFLPLEPNSPSSIKLQASLPGIKSLAPQVSMIACVGIEFAQQINQDFYQLEENRTMKIARIF